MKRVLFHVEPLVMHGKPFHYWAWLGCAAAMGRRLAAGGEWQVRVVLNAALATRAVAPHAPARRTDPRNGHALPREWLAVLHQEELRAPYGVPNVEILRGHQRRTWPEAALARHAALLRERLGAFTPEVIVSWTPNEALARAFPDALLLHTENGMFSRAPYPGFQFFDPQGLYDRSVPGAEAPALRAFDAAPDELAFVRRWRAQLEAQHRASSPFGTLVARLRERYPRVALLPLQFGGEAGFDLNGPFRNQGEYLLHVLERLPDDVGLIVSEHPTAHWLGDRIDEETLEWVRTACPQVAFVPLDAAPHAGQTLVPHVDSVISLSSSLGWHALFWGRELVCPGSGHLAAWAHAHDVAATGRSGADTAPPDAALAWMLTRYFVRNLRCLDDDDWVRVFFAGALARWRAGRRGLEFFEPAEPLAALEKAALGSCATSAPRLDPANVLVANGDFADAPAGMPRHWELLNPNGAVTSLDRAAAPRAGFAVRLARRANGSGPTLLLQRIPGIARLAGATITVGFDARGERGSRLGCYLYLQPGEGAEPRGSVPREYRLTPAWRRYAYTVTVPALKPGEALGAGDHTELVLMMPPDRAALTIEVADVRIGPPEWLEEAA
ncbi:MAG TPA: hypothetical protein VMH61_08400 [Candidatus Acidoferrales bacterium]|nr:hypothetical protein [Candidatus Acidoferrales bacterium]